MNSVTYYSSDAFKRPNFGLIFFKATCHAKTVAVKRVKSIYFNTHISRSFQIHELTIMYRLEHTNHGILVSFLF